MAHRTVLHSLHPAVHPIVLIDTHDRAHAQLFDLDIVGDDLWFGTAIERAIEHLSRVCVKLWRESRPLETERHGVCRLRCCP